MIKLNLLPDYRKNEIKKSRNLRHLLRWEFQLFAVLLIFWSLLFTLNYILQSELNSVSSQTQISADDQAKYQKIKEYEAEILDINARTSQDAKIRKGQFFWSVFLSNLSEQTLPAINIQSLTTKDYATIINGKAATRDDLTKFKDNLANGGCFTDVALPLSNLLAKENLDFQITFNIKSECLNKNK